MTVILIRCFTKGIILYHDITYEFRSCSVYGQTGDFQMKEKLGEQKITIDQLMLGLDFYKSNPQIAELIKELKGLQQIYDRS